MGLGKCLYGGCGDVAASAAVALGALNGPEQLSQHAGTGLTCSGHILHAHSTHQALPALNPQPQRLHGQDFHASPFTPFTCAYTARRRRLACQTCRTV